MSNRSPLIGPLGLVSALAVAFLLIMVPGALADQSLTDPTGDAGSAPDIGAVSATNDPAGNITLTIATNEPQLDPNAAFFAYFDTDSNGATGLQEAGIGAEYFLLADATGAILAEVQGNVIFVHLTSTATAGYSAGTETIRVNRSDLGDASSFRFLVESDQDDGNGNTLATDKAPDGPPYPEYSLTQAVVLTLSVARPAPLKGKPVAGKPFVVAATVTRSDGAAFTSGVVSCKARVGTKSLRAAGLVRPGSARCSMRVPKSAKGKLLRGTMSVSTSGAAAVSRTFAFRIG